MNYSNGILNYPKWIARCESHQQFELLSYFIAIATHMKHDVVVRVDSMLRKHDCLSYYINRGVML